MKSQKAAKNTIQMVKLSVWNLWNLLRAAALLRTKEEAKAEEKKKIVGRTQKVAVEVKVMGRVDSTRREMLMVD